MNMKLHYQNKRTEKEIFNNIPDLELIQKNKSDSDNLLINSDNLIALKQLITKFVALTSLSVNFSNYLFLNGL